MVTAEEVIRSLPGLLREKPELKWQIYEILSEEFAKKLDLHEYMEKSEKRFQRSLRELRKLREDGNRRFEAMERRFEELREESNRRFEAMERRFEELREESNRRFEEMREESNRRFEEMREESNRRFEESNRRIEELRKESERRFEAIERRFDKIERDFSDLKDWVGVVVGHFQVRAGRNLEEAIAGTLRISLGRDVRPESIMMRKKIIDEEGVIGPKGRGYEVDLCVTDDESLIFEIKSYADAEDVERFNDKAELAIKQLNLRKPEKAIITLEKHPSLVKFCQQMGIRVG